MILSPQAEAALTDGLNWASLAMWLIFLPVLAPGSIRLVRGAARHLDPLWFAILLLVFNRIAFSVNYLAAPWLLMWCRATAIAGGVTLLIIILKHQRYDT